MVWFQFRDTSHYGTLSSEALASKKLLDGLINAFHHHDQKMNCARIAIGYNSNLDLIVNAIDFLQNLKLEPPLTKKNFSDDEVISSMDQFLETFLHYFSIGSAAERFVVDSKLYEQLLIASMGLSKKQWFIGGNAALMATRLSMEGCEHILLGGRVGKKLASLLPHSIELVHSPSFQDTLCDETSSCKQSPSLSPISSLSSNEGSKELQDRYHAMSMENVLSEDHEFSSDEAYGIRGSSDQEENGAESESERDTIHLILEYERGSQFGNVVSPRANRFIIHHDSADVQLSLLDEFHRRILDYHPEVVVISGLHLLDDLATNIEDNFGENGSRDFHLITSTAKRLEHVASTLRSVPLHVPVHLEMASLADPVFAMQLSEHVVNFVDSIGLNEQELAMIYGALGGDRWRAKDFIEPTLNTVIDALEFLIDRISSSYKHLATNDDQPSPNNRSFHSLSRIHFHCLHFHVLATIIGGHGAWRDARKAVAGGAWAASHQACDRKNLDISDLELLLPPDVEIVQSTIIAPLEPSEKQEAGRKMSILETKPDIFKLNVDKDLVISWNHKAHNNLDNSFVVWRFVITPVLVCKKPARTVGLGDTISAVGLLYHLQ